MPKPAFVYIWKYRVNPEKRADYHAAYHPQGEWARLFARDPAYQGTELLQDSNDRNVFMTIDHWTSRAARDRFRDEHRDAFDRLDAECEAYTEVEEFVGDFVVALHTDRVD